MLNTVKELFFGRCNFRSLISNVFIVWRFFGINIDRRNETKIPVIYFLVNVCLAVFHVYVYVVSAYWFVFIRKTDDITCALIIFSLGVSSLIGVTKWICMFFYQDIVREIVDGYLECDGHVEPNSLFETNLSKTLLTIKRRAILYWTVVMGDGTTYILIAFLKPGKHFMEDCFSFYGAEEVMFQSPYYEILFLINAATVYFVVYLPANITVFFITTVGYTEAQLLAMGEELSAMWDNANKSYEATKDQNNGIDSVDNEIIYLNNYIKVRLHSLVKMHIMNITLISKVEMIISTATLLQFVYLIITIISVLLGDISRTYIQLPFCLIMVAMDCFIGQKLRDAGTIFENAVYACKWENFDVANRRMVLLMLKISQKGISLMPGGLKRLDNEYLMKVFNIIYSAYTALKSSAVD